VSPRRLILTALVCGLAILVAGGIQLFRISGNDPVELPRLGERRTVSGVEVTAVAVHDVGTATVVEVEVKAAPDASRSGSAGEGWTLFRTSTFAPAAVPAGSGEPCAAVSLSAVAQRCVVAFEAPGDGDRFLEYARDGVVARWALQ